MLPTLYAITLFVGAALLFLVQPLVGKLLLPLVGGTPGVWNTCMVFFQIVLLAGYLYAHRSTGRLGVRRQAAFHLLLLVVMVLVFKVAIAATGSPVPVVVSLLPDDQDYPIVGVTALVFFAVGVPFFVLSTTSPLLQRWFATSGHPAARDPYFLYAASNAGSLLGLLAYPFLIEPWLTLSQQQWVFAGGVGAYVALVTVCAATVLRRPAAEVEHVANPSPRPDRKRVLRWVALAALPSSLLLGATTHVSTDLAPVPLLWVVPLSLYLLSFILVFARWPNNVHQFVGRVTPMFLLFVIVTLLTHAAEPFALVGALHMVAFFGICLVCHGELAKDRPPPEHLTAFYFWLSLGGVLGGLFNALVAPMLFHKLGMIEYPLALVLAAAVRPRGSEQHGPPLRTGDVVLVLGLLACSVGLVLAVPYFVTMPVEPDSPDALPARLLRGGLMFGIPAAAAFALVRRPARYALSLAALLVAGAFDRGELGETLHMERNFFGVVRVTRSPDGKFIRLIHGTTLHGQQRADEHDNPRPMTYYHPHGPVGHLFDKLPSRPNRKVGVVGLGTGAVAYYARPGDEWTFYEIDPAVVRIAEDPQYFRFLSSCRERGATCNVVLGDARRQIVRAPESGFDVIIIDGFCSDAIPVHLLTREAIALYVSKLAPGGVIALHISNNHLDLKPLIRRLADDHPERLSVRYTFDSPFDADREDGKTASQWMLLGRSEADLEPIVKHPVLKKASGGSVRIDWREVAWEDGPIWRDDFANILRLWKKRDHNDF